ncbi:hypothetical protein C3747_75g4 [Trypanosoma cruzi]|uniref:Uncharacterized protein n=1 Tax=Trypanosoma cruzi TaxID=5693 RepID=A0A2V2WNG6_TRYCR|nr:hypothetical protein C3747_75g4 [Trypanosoma cruzi]
MYTAKSCLPVSHSGRRRHHSPRHMLRVFLATTVRCNILYLMLIVVLAVWTFAQGEVAMNCYLAVHLSLLQPRPNGSCTDDMCDEENTSLIFMEFAQCVPCVNPYLLRNGELSRHLMRYKTRMPSLQAAAPSPSPWSVANHFVVTWHEATENDLDSNPKRRVVRDGPHFPVTDTSTVGSTLVKKRNDAIAEAVWSLLRPEKRSPTDGDAVTVLDLWWEYYQRYVLHKTEPAEGRIKDPYFLFAHKPTVAQEFGGRSLPAKQGAPVMCRRIRPS